MKRDPSDKAAALDEMRRLLLEERWAALAVIEPNGRPAISQVAFAAGNRFEALYLHLSALAAHTASLAEQPACALAIGRPDCDSGNDPQRLPRVTMQGRAEPIPPTAADYAAAKARYLEQLPDAEPRFEFGDFSLYRFIPERLRYVGGFGRAFSFRPEQLQITDDSQ